MNADKKMQSKFVPFEPKINSGNSARLPDDFSGAEGSLPPADHIVAYTREGQVASIYSDDTWDFSAYQRRKPTARLYFASWFKDEPNELQRTIIEELKWLMFLEIYCRSTQMKVTTLYERLVSLRSLARFAYEHSKTTTEVFTNPLLFRQFLDTQSNSIKPLSALFDDLVAMGEKKVGFSLFGIYRPELKRRSMELNKKSQQHPPIPTRIYLELIVNLHEELDTFETIADSYLAMIDECSDQLSGRNHTLQREKLRKRGQSFCAASAKPTFTELVSKHNLATYFDYVHKKHGYLITELKYLASWLKNIQFLCCQIIHIFSGMRDGEVNRLPLDCLKTFKHNGNFHYRIVGATFKLTNEISKPTSWITSHQGARAISIAQKIAEVIFRAWGDVPDKINRSNADYPLFIASSYLGIASQCQTKTKPYSSSKFGKFTGHFPNLLPMIKEEDIKELEAIDPFRAWQAENVFEVGNSWYLTDHQYRRSLALYASASGMVSLPSLRRELQHITNEMTLYYAKGSAYAKDLVSNYKGHFYQDYQATKPEAQALSYISQVLMAREPLFGAHGTWIERHFETEETITANARHETFQRFKKGEIAYKETPLGGCTTVEPCDKMAMRSIVGCLECSKSIIKESQLGKVIRLQEVFVKTLDPESIEGRTENAELDHLKQYHTRITQKMGLNHVTPP